MKNNKGFTLTEVIVSISIIAIIMIIAIPSINNIMKNSKNQISSITKKNIEESAKLFGQEVYMCDQPNDISSLLNIPASEFKCSTARNLLISGITVTIGFLKDNQYFSDKSGNCDIEGEVVVSLEIIDNPDGTQTEGKILVHILDNLKCK